MIVLAVTQGQAQQRKRRKRGGHQDRLRDGSRKITRIRILLRGRLRGWGGGSSVQGKTAWDKARCLLFVRNQVAGAVGKGH